MLRSCLALFIAYALLAAGYGWWLGRVFDPPGLWIGAGAAALLVGGSLGALYNAWVARSEWSLIAGARHDLPLRAGRWAAAVGEIHPVSEPLIAPFSGEACVLCEYDVASQHRITPASRRSKANPGSDFAGFLMNPCVVRGRSGDVQLLGFPNLVEFGERTLDGPAAAARAREFLLQTPFEDRSGLKLVSVFSAIQAAWSDDDGLVRINIRLGRALPAELFPPALEHKQASVPAPGELAGENQTHQEHDEEDDDDDDVEDELEPEQDEVPADDDLSVVRIRAADIPLLKEKRVRVGERVCAIGIYDAARRGLVPGGLGADRFVKLIRGREADLEGLARSRTLANFWGGIVALLVIHLAAVGAMLAARVDVGHQQRWEQEAYKVAADKQGSVRRFATLVGRGVPIDGRDGGEPLLAVAQNPQIAQWLIAQGTDVNCRSARGLTPLMIAASAGNGDLVRALIARKADVNLRDQQSQATALSFALNNGHSQIAELLRAAGAKDDADGP